MPSPELATIKRLRRKPFWTKDDIHRFIMPTEEEMRVFEVSGVFNALDEVMQKLGISCSSISPINPFYKAGRERIAVGVSWDFQNGVADDGSPIRSCNKLEVTARLDDGGITIISGRNVVMEASREQWSRNTTTIASEIQDIEKNPQRITWSN